jgi:hypothetical protein
LVSVRAPDTVRLMQGQTVSKRASVFGAGHGTFNTPVIAGTGTYPEDCGSKTGFNDSRVHTDYRWLRLTSGHRT